MTQSTWLKVLLAALYFLVTRMNKFEFDEIPGGQRVIDEAHAKLGPVTAAEKRTLFRLLSRAIGISVIMARKTTIVGGHCRVSVTEDEAV